MACNCRKSCQNFSKHELKITEFIAIAVMSGDEYEQFESSISDGIIEVIGIVSSFHMAQLQVGLNKPIRLGRARNVRIQLKESFPVQADGEPWIQTPSEINISCNGQAKMLQCSS